MRAFIGILLAFFIAGCAGGGSPKVPRIVSHMSDAVIITPKQGANTIFVHFKNSANLPNSNTAAVVMSELVKGGFLPTADMLSADYIVLGDVFSFERREFVDVDPFFDVGFGFGRRHWGAGFGFPFGRRAYYDDFVYTKSYEYTMRASVLVRAKTGEERGTMVTLKQGGATYSPSYILPYFYERLAQQIVGFFYKF